MTIRIPRTVPRSPPRVETSVVGQSDPQRGDEADRPQDRVGVSALRHRLARNARQFVLTARSSPTSHVMLIKDVKVLLNSEPHSDHAGGLAVIQYASGAKLWASEASADVIAARR